MYAPDLPMAMRMRLLVALVGDMLHECNEERQERGLTCVRCWLAQRPFATTTELEAESSTVPKNPVQPVAIPIAKVRPGLASDGSTKPRCFALFLLLSRVLSSFHETETRENAGLPEHEETRCSPIRGARSRDNSLPGLSLSLQPPAACHLHLQSANSSQLPHHQSSNRSRVRHVFRFFRRSGHVQVRL